MARLRTPDVAAIAALSRDLVSRAVPGEQRSDMWHREAELLRSLVQGTATVPGSGQCRWPWQAIARAICNAGLGYKDGHTLTAETARTRCREVDARVKGVGHRTAQHGDGNVGSPSEPRLISKTPSEVVRQVAQLLSSAQPTMVEIHIHTPGIPQGHQSPSAPSGRQEPVVGVAPASSDDMHPSPDGQDVVDADPDDITAYFFQPPERVTPSPKAISDRAEPLDTGSTQQPSASEAQEYLDRILGQPRVTDVPLPLRSEPNRE